MQRAKLGMSDGQNGTRTQAHGDKLDLTMVVYLLVHQYLLSVLVQYLPGLFLLPTTFKLDGGTRDRNITKINSSAVTCAHMHSAVSIFLDKSNVQA